MDIRQSEDLELTIEPVPSSNPILDLVFSATAASQPDGLQHFPDISAHFECTETTELLQLTVPCSAGKPSPIQLPLPVSALCHATKKDLRSGQLTEPALNVKDVRSSEEDIGHAASPVAAAQGIPLPVAEVAMDDELLELLQDKDEEDGLGGQPQARRRLGRLQRLDIHSRGSNQPVKQLQQEEVKKAAIKKRIAVKATYLEDPLSEAEPEEEPSSPKEIDAAPATAGQKRKLENGTAEEASWEGYLDEEDEYAARVLGNGCEEEDEEGETREVDDLM